MAVTIYLSGRWGNILMAQSMMIAYCKKHDLTYFIPPLADAYRLHAGHTSNPVMIPSTGEKPITPKVYREPNTKNGTPYYHEIPKMDNFLFEGYYQSFQYFDWCRDYILDTYNFPYNEDKGITSINVRMGDCVGSRAFPIAPRTYYQNAVKYMQDRGFNKFKVFSDNIPYCKQEFTNENFPNAEFTFSEGKTEREDWIAIHNCSNNICARSTFSLTAAWFNRNPDKICLVPTLRHRYWNSCNHNLLTGTDFIEIDFKETQLY